MEWKTGMKMHGFVVDKMEEMQDVSGILHIMHHEKTGALVAWLKRSEENKTFAIAFRTTPENDTGVFHILEHCVLCGSRKYPVKDPFSELLKSSVNTYMNALTYADRTVFPVSSRNAKDFMNLASVYLDAVFNPCIYDNPNIFYQEGWHYEIHGEEEEATYNGVVLNEMKGAYASVDETIVDEMHKMLFPDACYRYVSGGDPRHIPDLTYEEALDTHRRYYHPSNSITVLDGDIDMDAMLACMDEYFSAYEKREETVSYARQEPVQAKTYRYEYEIAKDEDPQDMTQLTLGKVVCGFDDVVDLVSWDVLGTVVAGNNEAPLVKPILDEGLGQDVELELIDGIYQPWAALTVRNTNEEDIPRCLELIRSTAKRIVEEGLDQEDLLSVLNRIEFSYNEPHEPSGRINVGKILDSWIYGGDPTLYLRFNEIFPKVREKIKEGYCEKLLGEFLLDNGHLCTLLSIPSNALLEQHAREEKEKLARIKQQWKDPGRYVRLNKELTDWQETPDSREALESIPRLSLSDVEPLPEDFAFVKKEIKGVEVLEYPKINDSIVYINLYFNLAGIKVDRLASFSQWLDLHCDLPTKGKGLVELRKALRRDTGKLSFWTEAFSPDGRRDACYPVATVSFAALKHKLDDAISLILEIMYNTVYDKETIRPILKQEYEDFRQEMISSGQMFGMRRAAARHSAEAVFREYTAGYSSGMFVKELNEHFDDKIDEFLEDCCLYPEILFSTSRLTVSATEGNEEAIASMIDRMSHMEANKAVVHYPLLPNANEWIEIPSQVSFTAIANNMKEIGMAVDPRMGVLSQMLSLDYLWDEIRVAGGAYGTGFSINSTGNFGAYSYRDAKPEIALEAYKGIGEYVEEASQEEEDIENYIISTLANADPLVGYSAKIRMYDRKYFRNNTYEKRVENRRKTLAMKAADMAAWAKPFEKLIQEATICIVGPRGCVDEKEFKALKI